MQLILDQRLNHYRFVAIVDQSIELVAMVVGVKNLCLRIDGVLVPLLKDWHGLRANLCQQSVALHVLIIMIHWDGL